MTRRRGGWHTLAVAGMLLASPLAAGPAPRTYVVAPGDTFRAIAQRFGLDMATLAAANDIPSPYLIRIGQVLRVPPAPLAPRPAPSAPQKNATAPRLAWPTEGALKIAFGEPAGRNRPNRGIDLAAYAGMPVRAAAAGRVIFAAREPERFGLLVVIDHGDGWATAYAHLDRLTVKEGGLVTARERIGFVGKTGAVRAPTLHFELRLNNRPLDPERYLPPRL